MVDNDFIESIKLTDSFIEIIENDEKVFNSKVEEIFSSDIIPLFYYNQYLLNICLGRFEVASELQNKFEKILDKYGNENKNYELSKLLFQTDDDKWNFIDIDELDDYEIEKIKQENNDQIFFNLYKSNTDGEIGTDYEMLNLYLANYILNKKNQEKILKWSVEKNINLRDLRIFYISTLRETLTGISTYSL